MLCPGTLDFRIKAEWLGDKVMKKKICMVVPSFSAKGGITSVVNGYKCSNLEEDYEISYVETYCDGNKIKKIAKAIQGYFAFRNQLNNNRPDIVHIHSSFGASFYRKMPMIFYAATKNIPIINHVHGSEIEKLYTNASRLNKKIIEKTFDKCTLVITLTEENRKKLSVIKTNTDFVVLNNYSVIHPMHIFSECKTVLFLGFITELKGCFDLPGIVNNVAKEIPDVQFIIGGEGKKEQVIEQLERLKVSEKVIFPGWVSGDKKDSLFKKSTMFLLPSYTEAMPMSILEAMGYGLPIVSTNVGGIPQLVKRGVNGYLYEPGDIEGIAKGIIEILRDKEKCIMMGMNSQKMVEEKYSLEKHIDELKRIYGEILMYKPSKKRIDGGRKK